VLSPEAGTYLSIVLNKPLLPGEFLHVEFAFDNGTTLSADIPVGLPSVAPARSPLPLESAEHA
jgi:hypothetical protein